MARPVDHERRGELLDAAVDHVVEHGFADLSWRTVAEGLGVSPTTLVHHFGDRHSLLTAILGRVRERARETLHVPPGADLPSSPGAVWAWSSAPRHASFFRLFFAVYGMALQDPPHYREFLDHVVSDWREAVDPDDDVQATLAIAVIRGLLLDLLTTGESDRVMAAFEAYLSSVTERDAPVSRRRASRTSSGDSTRSGVARPTG